MAKVWMHYLFILLQLDSNYSKNNIVVQICLSSCQFFSAKHGSLVQLYSANSDRKAHIIKLCYVVHYAYQCLESSRNIIYPQLMTHSVKILVLLESQPRRQYCEGVLFFNSICGCSSSPIEEWSGGTVDWPFMLCTLNVM